MEGCRRRRLPARGPADGRALRRRRRPDQGGPGGPDPHRLEKLGVTVLFVTHDIDESVYLGEHVIILSSFPTVIHEDIIIDLPADRDQLNTRALPRFTELRHHVCEQIQLATKGQRPAAAGAGAPRPAAGPEAALSAAGARTDPA